MIRRAAELSGMMSNVQSERRRCSATPEIRWTASPSVPPGIEGDKIVEPTPLPTTARIVTRESSSANTTGRCPADSNASSIIWRVMLDLPGRISGRFAASAMEISSGTAPSSCRGERRNKRSVSKGLTSRWAPNLVSRTAPAPSIRSNKRLISIRPFTTSSWRCPLRLSVIWSWISGYCLAAAVRSLGASIVAALVGSPTDTVP